MNDKPTFVGADFGQGDFTHVDPDGLVTLKRAPCPMAVIRGIASWARPSLALRFDAAAQTLPYMIRPPKERAKANGSPRQRRRMSR